MKFHSQSRSSNFRAPIFSSLSSSRLLPKWWSSNFSFDFSYVGAIVALIVNRTSPLTDASSAERVSKLLSWAERLIIYGCFPFDLWSRSDVAPLERLKILLRVQNPHSTKYNGTVQGLKYIWRTVGFRGLFKGNGTNCACIVPKSAVKFFSYEQASKLEGEIEHLTEAVC